MKSIRKITDRLKNIKLYYGENRLLINSFNEIDL